MNIKTYSEFLNESSTSSPEDDRKKIQDEINKDFKRIDMLIRYQLLYLIEKAADTRAVEDEDWVKDLLTVYGFEIEKGSDASLGYNVSDMRKEYASGEYEWIIVEIETTEPEFLEWEKTHDYGKDEYNGGLNRINVPETKECKDLVKNGWKLVIDEEQDPDNWSNNEGHTYSTAAFKKPISEDFRNKRSPYLKKFILDTYKDNLEQCEMMFPGLSNKDKRSPELKPIMTRLTSKKFGV